MNGKAEDRISNLPDSLLHHILSLLPTRLVARTSILSRRWKYIWTSIPILRFRYDKDSSDPISPTFIDYVDGTLHRRCFSDNDIHKFYLRSSHHLNESRVNTWISNVMSRNVKDFGLVLEQNDSSCIPQSLFACASLTSLLLRVLRDIDFPEYISFPRLKHLRLEGIKFSNDCWNEKFFSNCPVLEDLALLHCRFLTSIFCISIPTLKTLRIIAQLSIHDCTLKIHAPSLLTLIYTGNVAKEYVFSSLDTLVEAVCHIPMIYVLRGSPVWVPLVKRVLHT
ncbi:F-box/LRR-repeat protein At4g14103-like [Papaver somniferum]|uniref:F-box/LRR-repeat protein At4g14103-like n=1 Tax=Papaver somniferum TaxID=3469 RepID=UPI000E6FEE51|nr:F-box/LRR-repeat protein At4g14103-like [Papaver somniferum]